MSILNTVEAVMPLESVAVIVIEPFLPPGALKSVWNMPESFTVPLAMALLFHVTEKSLLAVKPDPLTFRSSLTLPFLGNTDKIDSMVNVTGITSVANVILPLAPIVWAPPLAAGILVVAVQWPLSSAIILLAINLSSKVNCIELSLLAKPLPVTLISSSTDPVL